MDDLVEITDQNTYLVSCSNPDDQIKPKTWTEPHMIELKAVFTLTKAKVIWARKPRKGHKINIFITIFTIAPTQLKLIKLCKKENRRPV